VCSVAMLICVRGRDCNRAVTVPAAGAQTETDEVHRTNFWAPESVKFAIRYQVTATTAGGRSFTSTNPQGQRGPVASRC